MGRLLPGCLGIQRPLSHFPITFAVGVSPGLVLHENHHYSKLICKCSKRVDVMTLGGKELVPAEGRPTEELCRWLKYDVTSRVLSKHVVHVFYCE